MESVELPARGEGSGKGKNKVKDISEDSVGLQMERAAEEARPVAESSSARKKAKRREKERAQKELEEKEEAAKAARELEEHRNTLAYHAEKKHEHDAEYYEVKENESGGKALVGGFFKLLIGYDFKEANKIWRRRNFHLYVFLTALTAVFISLAVFLTYNIPYRTTVLPSWQNTVRLLEQKFQERVIGVPTMKAMPSDSAIKSEIAFAACLTAFFALVYGSYITALSLILEHNGHPKFAVLVGLFAIIPQLATTTAIMIWMNIADLSETIKEKRTSSGFHIILDELLGHTVVIWGLQCGLIGLFAAFQTHAQAALAKPEWRYQLMILAFPAMLIAQLFVLYFPSVAKLDTRTCFWIIVAALVTILAHYAVMLYRGHHLAHTHAPTIAHPADPSELIKAKDDAAEDDAADDGAAVQHAPKSNLSTSFFVTTASLLIVLAIVEGAVTFFLVRQTENIAKYGLLNETFVGMVFLPIISNIWELTHLLHMTTHDAPATMILLAERAAYRLCASTTYAMLLSALEGHYWTPSLTSDAAIYIIIITVLMMYVILSGADGLSIAVFMSLMVLALVGGSIGMEITPHASHAGHDTPQSSGKPTLVDQHKDLSATVPTLHDTGSGTPAVGHAAGGHSKTE